MIAIGAFHLYNSYIGVWVCGSVVEHVPDKNGVPGSIPGTPTNHVDAAARLFSARIADSRRAIG